MASFEDIRSASELDPQGASLLIDQWLKEVDIRKLPASQVMTLLEIRAKIFYSSQESLEYFDAFMILARVIRENGSDSDRATAFVYLAEFLAYIGSTIQGGDILSIVQEAVSCLSRIEPAASRESAKLRVAFLFWSLGNIDEMSDLCVQLLAATNNPHVYAEMFHLYYGARLDRYYPIPIDSAQFLTHASRAIAMAHQKSDQAMVLATIAVYHARHGKSGECLKHLNDLKVVSAPFRPWILWANLISAVGFIENADFDSADILFKYLSDNESLIYANLSGIFQQVKRRLRLARFGYRKEFLINTNVPTTLPRAFPASHSDFLKLSLQNWMLRESFAQSEQEIQRIQHTIDDIIDRIAEVDRLIQV